MSMFALTVAVGGFLLLFSLLLFLVLWLRRRKVKKKKTKLASAGTATPKRDWVWKLFVVLGVLAASAAFGTWGIPLLITLWQSHGVEWWAARPDIDISGFADETLKFFASPAGVVLGTALLWWMTWFLWQKRKTWHAVKFVLPLFFIATAVGLYLSIPRISYLGAELGERYLSPYGPRVRIVERRVTEERESKWQPFEVTATPRQFNKNGERRWIMDHPAGCIYIRLAKWTGRSHEIFGPYCDNGGPDNEIPAGAEWVWSAEGKPFQAMLKLY